MNLRAKWRQVTVQIRNSKWEQDIITAKEIELIFLLGFFPMNNIVSYQNLRRRKKQQQCKVKREEEGSNSNRPEFTMMIAFITFNSNLVPLIKGLYSSNSCGFEFSFYVHIFCCYFSKRSNMFKNKAFSPRSNPTSRHIYSQVYFVHIYEYMYAEIQSIWILRALQVSRSDPWARIWLPHVQCVCVCAYTQTHTHVHSNPC